jgi:2-aminophenol/2-amino-5-chlorophenol 1,6-dioxygenase beta subunit
MRLVELMREGDMRQVIDLMPEFTQQTDAETEGGGLTWMMAAMGMPDYPAEIYGYQSVIGTGNVIACWDPDEETREVVL